jgi:F-type H+-transporting ATPase subunit alpha
VTILYAAINNYLDDVAVDKVARFEALFHKFMETNHPEIGKDIMATRELSEATEEKLKVALEEFKQTGAYKD